MAYTKKPVNMEAPSNNKMWTKDDINILQSLAAKGSSTAEIAKILGRTKASVWGRKSMMGIKGRLSSSKGSGISAPTTISTNARSGKQKIKIETPTMETQKKESKMNPSKANPAPQPTMYANAVQGLMDLKKLAKVTGAKIVITLE